MKPLFVMPLIVSAVLGAADGQWTAGLFDRVPRVHVGASYTTRNGVRMVDMNITADSDEYLLAGQIGPDGVLRFVYPSSPDDTSITAGGRAVHIPTFDAGYQAEYASRRRQQPYSYWTAAVRDASYDGGVGYLFVISSPHPLRRDQVSVAGIWSSMDLSDQDLVDPRRVVQDLAGTLAPGGPSDVAVTYVTRFIAQRY